MNQRPGSTRKVPASARFLNERKCEHSNHAVILDGVIRRSTIQLHTRFWRSCTNTIVTRNCDRGVRRRLERVSHFVASAPGAMLGTVASCQFQ